MIKIPMSGRKGAELNKYKQMLKGPVNKYKKQSKNRLVDDVQEMVESEMVHLIVESRIGEIPMNVAGAFIPVLVGVEPTVEKLEDDDKKNRGGKVGQ